MIRKCTSIGESVFSFNDKKYSMSDTSIVLLAVSGIALLIGIVSFAVKGASK